MRNPVVCLFQYDRGKSRVNLFRTYTLERTRYGKSEGGVSDVSDGGGNGDGVDSKMFEHGNALPYDGNRQHWRRRRPHRASSREQRSRYKLLSTCRRA